YDLLTERNRSRGARGRELVTQSDAQFQTAAQELSQMLLAPVAAKLAGKRLLIVPQGALQFVPFAALPEPEIGGVGETGPRRQEDKETRRQGDKEMEGSGAAAIRNPQSFTPLIVNHEVVVLPSASALGAIRRQKAARASAERSLLVFADPVFSAGDD